uniref:Bifunctional 5,10-methylene-tetrahydrofolate dehydrogenase/ 5,10-methylene-tetrahydrofolate cyclohydrolase n=1 Tax=uncultured organism TaxID=155900 RepID=M1PV81_9ZZZZ|nr:bifunctional 5,10-methylene-tetrahydrofolate dehydrogenase/ 5,10-methylene-tetrahydrofolate cyclohydrolase [uncultured organism]
MKVSEEIIDGRTIADEGEAELKKKIEEMEMPPRLDTIFAGDDEGSKVYLGVKNRGCERVGIETETHRYPSDVSQGELLDKIEELNEDDRVDGVLIQMPLPGEMDSRPLIERIDPVKDVEGLHRSNMGRLMTGDEEVVPCTPKGILTMLEYEGIDLKGKEVCIVSHSTIVGKPMVVTLLNRDATVEVVHEFTKDLESHTKKAEILITAAGKAHFITEDMISEGVVLIDVGMNRLENGDLVGDAVYEKCKEKASKITPVPGGVGPTTVLSLLQNTYRAAVRRRG